MPDPLHRIRRLRWTITTGSTAAAFDLRKRLREQWRELLLPALERAFDEAAGGQGERVIHIPKLEIHLKVASEQALTEALPDLLYRQMKEQLQSVSGVFPERFQAAAGRSALRRDSTVRQDRFDSLIHYLRTGALPWRAAHLSTSEAAVELKEACRQWPRLLDDLSGESAPFYFRLLQLADPEDSSALVRALAERIPHAWKTAAVSIAALLDSERRFFDRHTRLRLAAAWLAQSLTTGTSAPDFAAIAQSLLAPEETLADFIAALPAAAAGLFSRNISRQGTDASPASPIPATDRTAQALRSADAGPRPASFDSSPGLPRETASPISSAPARVDYPAHDKPAETEFPLAVQHAGLILLHPFLGRFFENTGVKVKEGPNRLPALRPPAPVHPHPDPPPSRGRGKRGSDLASGRRVMLEEADDARRSPAAAARAACLLHWLATGREEVYEYELGLIKVLLGLTPDTPLPVSEGLIRPDDRAEADALLHSVIKHWSVLKDTSIEGLRGSFLQRRALLREQDNGWRLQVESAPFDILLERLPWTIGIVKLPWMERAIHTEWPMP